MDSTDDVYQAWRNESISVREYLEHAIEEGWIDISHFNIADRYADSEEVYSALISFVSDLLEQDSEFDKLIYESLIMSDQISGRQLCLILYEQGVLDSKDDSDYQGLRFGSLSSYSFIRNKVKSLEITPAQLALNPCTGSCVILDPNTGETLACVSYPGYDNNRLANVMDTAYYNQLNTDGSLPLYNNATQQTTAPGSTFKMVTATAGLTEGVITPSTEIRMKVSLPRSAQVPNAGHFHPTTEASMYPKPSGIPATISSMKWHIGSASPETDMWRKKA